MRLSQIVTEKDCLQGKTRCRYCKHPIGNGHERGCEAIKRTAVIEVTFTYIKEFPANWTEEQINFYLNESSCASNRVHEINRLNLREEFNNCGEGFRGNFVREASEDDHDFLGYNNE